jgi:hypothetical protein
MARWWSATVCKNCGPCRRRRPHHRPNAQEYCDASLHAVLGAAILHDAGSRSPNMDLVLTVLQDVARGMAYIHAKNIIHGGGRVSGHKLAASCRIVLCDAWL